MRRFLLPLLLLAVSLPACDLVRLPEDQEPAPAYPLRTLWTAKEDVKDSWGKPAYGEGRVFVAARGAEGGAGLVALNATTGERLWRRDGLETTDTPIVGDGKVFVVRDRAVAYDAATGQRLWQIELPASAYASEPLFTHGMLVVGTEKNGTVMALDGATGAVRWSRTLGDPMWREGGKIYSMAVQDSELYAVLYQSLNRLSYEVTLYMVVLDAATGEEKRRSGPLAERPSSYPGRGLSFSPSNVYFSQDGQDLLALDRTTLREAWRLRAGTSSTTFVPYEAPLVVGQRLFYADRGDFAGERGMAVVALDAATGHRVWQTLVPNTRSGMGQVLCNGMVLAQSYHSIDAVDMATGAFRGNVYQADYKRRPAIVGAGLLIGENTYVYMVEGEVRAVACTPAD